MINIKTAQQIMDTGILNESVKGYLIQACKYSEIDRESIDKILNCLSWALDDMSASDAVKVYNNF